MITMEGQIKSRDSAARWGMGGAVAAGKKEAVNGTNRT